MRIYYFAEVTLNVMIFGWRLNTQAQAFNCVILTNADIHSSIYAIFSQNIRVLPGGNLEKELFS